ncbi:SRPBCC family protein [Actinophytocola sediminis]
MKLAAAAVGVAIAAAGCGSDGEDQSAGATDIGTPTTTSSAPTEQVTDKECGGTSIDHEAAVTRSSEIVIDASLQRVWDVQTDVESWTTWQRAITTIERLDPGALSATSQFRWTTPVPASPYTKADTLTITSSVQQLEPGKCVIWQGPAVGKAMTIDMGVHLWIFTETAEGTHVYTEESWDAELLRSLKGADYDAVADMLGGGLDLWLQDLKTTVETPAS